MKSVFFYGLFMDPDLLKDKGLNPGASEPAQLAGYGLKIGARATLVGTAEPVWVATLETGVWLSTPE
jgi:hypothetical protein